MVVSGVETSVWMLGEANGSANSEICVTNRKSRLSRSSRGTSRFFSSCCRNALSAWVSRIASSAYPGLSAALGKSVQKLAPGRVFTDQGEGAVLGHFARGGHERVEREARTAAANADPFDPGFGQLLQCQRRLSVGHHHVDRLPNRRDDSADLVECAKPGRVKHIGAGLLKCL